jgi:hypothetical protein
MGANAQTAVPAFTAGQVLTAAQMTEVNTGIPVFATTVTRDAAFGGTGEKVLAEGQMAYIEASNTTQYYDGAAWQSLGPAGLVLVQAETAFTTAVTFSANNVFTSAYRNYRIVLNCTNGDGSITFKLRASGTDTSANYYGISTYGTATNPYQSAFNALGTDELYMCDMQSATDGSGVGIIDVLSPQAAFATVTQGNFYGSSAGNQFWYSHFGRQTDATQFDGFTFLITTTGMTGTYTVYGYNK